MRILHLIQRYPPAIGGSEQWAAALARRQAQRGCDVEVLTYALNLEDEYWRLPDPEERVLDLGARDFDEGVRVRRYRRTLLNPFKLQRSRSALLSDESLDPVFDLFFSGPHSLTLYADLPRRVRRADLVHLHAVPYPHNGAGYLIARFFKKPVVLTPHFHPGHAAFEKTTTLSLVRNCDAVFTVSEWEREYLEKRGVARSKLHVTANAIDPLPYESRTAERQSLLRKRLGIPDSAPVVSYLGRKVLQKGVGLLLKSVEEMLARVPGIHVVLAGPGSAWFDDVFAALPPSTKARVRDAGVLSEADKIALLQTSRVLVLPGVHEAFGIAFLEAWAAGVPVVGARSGAIPHVIDGAGLTFTPDDAGDLTARVAHLVEDRALSEKLVQTGRRYVRERYTWDGIMETVERAYAGLVG